MKFNQKAGQVLPMWSLSPTKELGDAVVWLGFINVDNMEIASISGIY